ncbi:hypothetical protein RED65_02764 [Oceanobacter sp. RED65]|uniref:Uncharacterized protein n=1 Tax=Bermanella marisrubri TaxID=207949 RepID=Q1N006_9GAMM|nr:hypothetical protein RED65_02764 [Oceanobacter sp. RED65] [Bermanella marisrubri]
MPVSELEKKAEHTNKTKSDMKRTLNGMSFTQVSNWLKKGGV